VEEFGVFSGDGMVVLGLQILGREDGIYLLGFSNK
jgi:hypothetical protein